MNVPHNNAMQAANSESLLLLTQRPRHRNSRLIASISPANEVWRRRMAIRGALNALG